MPYLTPRAERALCAYLEANMIHDAQHINPLSNPYAPLDFNAPTIPNLPDWAEYYHDDYSYAYN